jgi:hypothetical protein
MTQQYLQVDILIRLCWLVLAIVALTLHFTL